MRRDPLEALESFYANQAPATSRGFDGRVADALASECAEVDLTPAMNGLRKALPAAAAIVLGVLTPRISSQDVQRLANQVDQAQLESASSVRTELETPWQD